MLRKCLADLPTTLDQTYERILGAIDKDDSQYVLRILRWLAFSARPLRLKEVAEIVAIDVTRNPAFDKDDVLEDPSDALEMCSSLVTTNVAITDGSEDRTIALAHYSIKEYLVSDRIRQSQVALYSLEGQACNDYIAQCCVGYLLQFQNTEAFSNETIESYQMTRYAAQGWIRHAKAGFDSEGPLSRLILKLFSPQNGAYLNWLRVWDPVEHYGPQLDRNRWQFANPLYYASYVGLSGIARMLIEQTGADVNAQGGSFGNALQAALYEGNEQIVELLLSSGADVNAQGGRFGNALQAASYIGNKEIVELLLSNSADVNAQGGRFGNTLQAALYKGSKQIVELLLSKGADINAQGGIHGNALQAAVFRGHEQIVELLLGAGFDVGYYGDALRTAEDWGRDRIAELLLSRGARREISS